ncbi:hypothetical protein [Paraburkholderia caledonica]|uniref:hypothetical protein n=1 Tax=Paraburkholderia caledonica TaxID=134536 RepID=UPI000DEF8DF5|nr:hypothetical protein [Paraburkholderia caledonica]AXF12989.1 hypothetical protein CUJ87_00045 [Paraburkholderia caledonica]
MSLTQPWTPDSVLKGPHLLYDAAQEDRLCTALKANSANPLTYKLKPNGTQFSAVIWAFLCFRDDASRSWFLREAESEEAAVYHLINETQNLAAALANIASENVLFSADRILAAKIALPNDFRWVVELIRDMAFELFPVLAYGSAYSFSHMAEHNRAWWRFPPKFDKSVAEFQRRFNRVWHQGVPTQIAPIENWLGALRRRLLGFHSPSITAPVSRTDAVREASAYCGAMAEQQLLMGHRALALVTLHRAADLLFFSLCIDKSLIDFTANFSGGWYASGIGASSPEVSLKTSAKLVDSYLSPDPSRLPAFDELNKWRNQLIYTHYLSDVEDSELRRLFALCRPHLERLGGRQWIAARDALLSGPQSGRG